MARTAAIPSVVVVVSSLFLLSLARRTVDQLPSGAEGSATPFPTLDAPHHLLPPNGESDPSVAGRDPDERTNLQAAKPLEEEEDPAAAALAVAVAAADRRPPRRSFLICLLVGCGNEGIEPPRGGGDAAALPGAAMEEGARGGSEEAERAEAGAEANRSVAEVMGWAPKREEEEEEEWGGEGGEGAKRRGKKPRDSDSDSDSDSDDEEEEEEEEGERKRKMKKKKMKKKKGKRGFLKWFWRLVNRS